MTDMHTLTRESQEVMVGVIVFTDLSPSKSLIVCISISHSGQLNITTSTLSRLLKSGVSLKSKVISVLRVVVCSVSS